MRTPTPTVLFRSLLAAGLCCAALACSSGGSGPSDKASADGGGEAAAGESPAAPPGTVYPGAEWATADAASVGFDQAKLDAIAADAQASGSNCLLVARKGKVVGEWYWNGTDGASSQEVFSATKSYASTLVGLAQADGKLSITDKASTYITEWQGTPSEPVTIENILANDSGRQLSPAIDYTQLPFSPDMDALAIGLTQEHDPGTAWGYNNAAIQTLDAILSRALGGDVASYAQDRLLDPIGMANSHMTTDRAGNTKLFMGLQSTCPDMARYGYLFLRDGDWDGTQIVPADWVEAATGQPSQDLNSSYGFLWWLNRPGNVLGAGQATGQGGTTATTGGGEGRQMVRGAPDDMYFALGLGGQIIVIDPGSETVVVRLAPFRGLGGNGGLPNFGVGDAARVVTEALVDPGVG
jgi:CubicO group peptidase (beta-lactamase class C family)